MSYFIQADADCAPECAAEPCTPVRELSGGGLRYYIPTLGRWLSKDPLGEHSFFLRRMDHGYNSRSATLDEVQGASSYVFASNAPVVLMDYLGLIVVPIYESGTITWGAPCSFEEAQAIENAYSDTLVSKLKTMLKKGQIPQQWEFFVECLVGEPKKPKPVNVQCNPCSCMAAEKGGFMASKGTIKLCGDIPPSGAKYSLGTVVAVELAKNQCGLMPGKQQEYAFADWLETLQ